jgi:spore coat protein U-like protein
MKSSSPAFALAFLLLSLDPRSSIAATASTSFGVTVTVQSGCLVLASARAYRTLTASVANAASAFSVSCSNPTPHNVGLSLGLAPNSTVATRKIPGRGLVSFAHALTSSAEGMVTWGPVVDGDSAAEIFNGFFQALSGISQASARQFVADGALADTLTVTVTY